jgi:hypothetical protein
MFGRRYFGGQYWEPAYFGGGSDTSAPPAAIDPAFIRRVVRGGLITRLVQEAIARGTKGQ